MNFEQITALTYEECFDLLLPRILDISGITGPSYSLDVDEEKDFYARIMMNEALVKPSIARIEEELADYKAELTAIEQARLDEIARVADINARWNAIADIRGAIHKASIAASNPATELKRMILENDTAALEDLEAGSTVWNAEQVKLTEAKTRKDAGALARNACDEVLNLIAGINLERTLTAEQIDTMQATFASTFGMLSAGRPWTAKLLLIDITPDGTIVTEDMKTAILEEFARHGI